MRYDEVIDQLHGRNANKSKATHQAATLLGFKRLTISEGVKP